MEISPAKAVSKYRRAKSLANHSRGNMAEDQVVEAYRRCGFAIHSRRFRVREGEIDIVAQHGNKFYFVEVKSARSHDAAMGRITPYQQRRIYAAAERFLEKHSADGRAECRVDAALVDYSGRVKVVPGALHM
ncbi:MAG: YraN family protein [Pseudomonadota bacterium]